MKFKIEKMMEGGKWIKVNGKFIESIGWFAFDGCHKIYILESRKDLEKAMYYGYRIYPITDLRKTWESTCPLRFIHNLNMSKTYVKQFESRVVWDGVKVSDKEMKKWQEEHPL